MRTPVVWHGTADEALALLAAVDAHCTCRKQGNRRVTPCPPHTMLALDQRAVDGLLFMRRLAQRLVAQEFAQPEAAPAAPVATNL